MRYAMLVYRHEADHGGAWAGREADYVLYLEQLRRTGGLRESLALHESFTATTIRVHDGEQHMYDGPHNEPGEQLVRILVVECEDLDAALDLAAACPDAHCGSVEIRPMAPVDG